MPETSTRPSDVLAQTLSRLANDRRARIRYYGNIDALPGQDRVPRRLLSDYGFLQNAQFTYVVPAPANVVVGDPGERRPCTLIALYPYGVSEDHTRLTSSLSPDRRVSSVPGQNARGVVPYPTDATYYMSAALDAATVSPVKTANMVRKITSSRNGASYHFLVTRTGDVLVGAALDDQTLAAGALAETSIDIALESALVIKAEDWQQRRFDQLIEMPLTLIQVASLSILVAKLQTAYPQITSDLVNSPRTDTHGVSYVWPEGLSGTTPWNFTSGAWKNQGLPFDYTNSDAPAFFEGVALYGPFDLTTQIFRPLGAPIPQATRAAARSVLGQIDTAGAQSVLLGAYADLAAPERSYDMQQTPRRQLFVNRIQRAHAEADDAGSTASNVSEAGEAATTEGVSAVINSDPHTYNFATGTWGDHKPY